MEPAQHSARRPAVIVLHERQIETRLGKRGMVPAFEKEAALIAKHLGLDDDGAGDVACDKAHQKLLFSSRLSR